MYELIIDQNPNDFNKKINTTKGRLISYHPVVSYNTIIYTAIIQTK